VETITEQASNLRQAQGADRRWAGIRRDYPAEDVMRPGGSLAGEHAIARRGAERLWGLLQSEDAVRALGAVTGGQAVQQVKAGLRAIYLPARRDAGHTCPDQARYPLNSVPQTVRRINNAMLRAGQQAAPVVADAEAGSGGVPGAFELMTSMIEAGAAGVLFDDQLSPGQGHGHLGGKVLIPTGQHVETLRAARLAADELNVPALVIARTGAHAAFLLTSDADERDQEFLTGERTAEGLYRVQPGLYACMRRGLAFAPYADLLWLETSAPSLAEARAFADIIYSQYPDQLLAYSCSPSFNWRAHLDDAQTATFQRELAAMGYRFQAITESSSPRLDPKPQLSPGVVFRCDAVAGEDFVEPGAGLVVEVQVEGGDGVVELLDGVGADDGAGHTGALQEPRERDAGRRMDIAGRLRLSASRPHFEAVLAVGEPGGEAAPAVRSEDRRDHRRQADNAPREQSAAPVEKKNKPEPERTRLTLSWNVNSRPVASRRRGHGGTLYTGRIPETVYRGGGSWLQPWRDAHP
jgi:isocitrate lyase